MDDAATAILPDDPKALKALCAKMIRERDSLAAERARAVAERNRIAAETE